MSERLVRLCGRVVWAVAPALLLGAEAWARQTPTTPPPAPKNTDSPSFVLTYVIIGALVVATVMVSVMPSKRGHKD